MTTDANATDLRHLTLTAEEVGELLTMLVQSLSETRVEVHRTHTPDFRDAVQHREVLLKGMIEKLRRTGA